MNIGIIGAGKVGCSLAVCLNNNGFYISGIYSRTSNSQEYLCDKLGKSFQNSLTDTVKSSDVIFICVSDNNIKDCAEEIAEKVNPKVISLKTFIHLSGALTTEELQLLEAKGGYTGSLHPVQAIADRDNSWEKLYNIYYGFEGCKRAEEHASKIVEALGGSIIHIKKQDKPLYHAAACIMSNYTVTLSYVAHEVLKSIGLDENTSAKAFFPLIENTVDNLRNHGSVNALTGPISRGDHNVISEHLKALFHLSQKLGEIYKVLGSKTIEVAFKKGTLLDEDAENLKKLLE